MQMKNTYITTNFISNIVERTTVFFVSNYGDVKGHSHKNQYKRNKIQVIRECSPQIYSSFKSMNILFWMECPFGHCLMV